MRLPCSVSCVNVIHDEPLGCAHWFPEVCGDSVGVSVCVCACV